MTEFRYRLRRMMSEREMSVADLANAAGFSYAMVYRWLKGKTRPNYESVERLCEALEVSPDELFGWR